MNKNKKETVVMNVNTVGELLDSIKDLPRDAPLDNPEEGVIKVHASPDPDNFNFDDGKYELPPVVNTMAEHMLTTYGKLCGTDETSKHYDNFVEDYYNDDQTALTDIGARGPVEYIPTDYDMILPPAIREAVDRQRVNNTNFVDELLEIDRQAMEAKANIDYMAAKAKYQIMAEYNTQCDMHLTGAIMCQIVAEQVDNMK